MRAGGRLARGRVEIGSTKGKCASGRMLLSAVALPSAALGTIENLRPAFRPLLPPGKRALAYRAKLSWKLRLFAVLCHLGRACRTHREAWCSARSRRAALARALRVFEDPIAFLCRSSQVFLRTFHGRGDAASLGSAGSRADVIEHPGRLRRQKCEVRMNASPLLLSHRRKSRATRARLWLGRSPIQWGRQVRG